MIEITACDRLLMEREIELVSPTSGEALGAFVTVAGPEHPARRARVYQRQREIRARWEADGQGSAEDPELAAAGRIDDAVISTLSWRGFVNAGAEIPCTPEEVRAIYANPELAWIPAQVMAAVNKTEDFFVAPVPTSAKGRQKK